MKPKPLTPFEHVVLKLKQFNHVIKLLIVFILIPLVYILVIFTGGIRYVYSHTMYLPILFAGLALGAKWGVIAGILGGLMLGPLMPFEVSVHSLIPFDITIGQTQAFANWMYRLMMFTAIGAFSGISADLLRKQISSVKELFSHNPETNLPNINELQSILDYPHPEKPAAIMTILINNHTNIIDLMGSDVYHALIAQVFFKLKQECLSVISMVQSESNKLWIIKPAGDPYLDIHKALSILNKNIDVEGIPLYVEYSIGYAIKSATIECAYPGSFRDSDMAAKSAQMANIPYVIYDESYALRRSDFELLGIFNQAIEQGHLYMVYQPKIDLVKNQVYGLEALIRWKHPIRGIIRPDVFIPLIEETQLVHTLTDFVLKEALKRLVELKKQKMNWSISINVSTKNLYDPNFFTRFHQMVEDFSISPSKIELEITESALMQNAEECKKMLSRFVDQGYKISIDDFGKGYSSLAYLSEFPIHILKLDQYFMRHIDKEASVGHIVKASIDLAHQLGYQVVAEGIEEEAILEIIKSYGCDYAQGYHFAKPMLFEELFPWVETFKT